MPKDFKILYLHITFYLMVSKCFANQMSIKVSGGDFWLWNAAVEQHMEIVVNILARDHTVSLQIIEAVGNICEGLRKSLFILWVMSRVLVGWCHWKRGLNHWTRCAGASTENPWMQMGRELISRSMMGMGSVTRMPPAELSIKHCTGFILSHGGFWSYL